MSQDKAQQRCSEFCLQLAAIIHRLLDEEASEKERKKV